MSKSGYTKIDHNISIKSNETDQLTISSENTTDDMYLKRHKQLIGSVSILFIVLMAYISVISRIEPTLSSSANPKYPQNDVPYVSVILTVSSSITFVIYFLYH